MQPPGGGWPVPFKTEAHAFHSRGFPLTKQWIVFTHYSNLDMTAVDKIDNQRSTNLLKLAILCEFPKPHLIKPTYWRPDENNFFDLVVVIKRIDNCG